jgi:prepilin-type N-terminal cleavage/methylation domain-containing protein
MRKKSGTSASRSAFTLIELLVVIAIIAILSVVVILTLNPAQLFSQARDSSRLSDMGTIAGGVNLYNSDQGGSGGYSLGIPNVAYLSIPDPTATTTAGTNCAGLGFSGNYHCAASSTYRNANGTGWIPINFASTTNGSPLSVLPVDPINTTSSAKYYEYMTDGSAFEVVSNPESSKYVSQSPNFAVGSSQILINPTYVTSTYAVGSYPQAVAFDSHTNSIWVANYNSNTVTQINDTSYVTSSYAVGLHPNAIAFDSNTNSIWITNYSDNTVTQINDTSYVKTTYAVGSNPFGIAFDSNTNSIWVGNYSDNTVTQINDTSYMQATYAVGSNPFGIAFDSHTNSIWVGNFNSYNIMQINDTTYVKTTYSVASQPQGIAFDPHTNSLWATIDTVTQINDTSYVKTTYAIGSNPIAVAFDSHTNSLWVVNQTTNTVIQLMPSR